ncbi:hypothetical protein [Dactylosporangium sp. CS-033363]|uniref:hypothetical protein n=1 Tax=Dactylosporangium sp. CS-033363 TaxID=3239935 RepID=UPI003D8CD323
MRTRWYRTPRREVDELPSVAAHHVLVYRSAGQYILDNSGLHPSDPVVVDARQVAVVDMRRMSPVPVDLAVASADSGEFTVRVTFLATVVDPVAVVRGGLTDLTEVLRTYLRSHHRIYEHGRQHRLAEVHEAGRRINAQIMAYTTIKPPAVDGMSLSVAGVEVLVPLELADFEQRRREQLRDLQLLAERQEVDEQLQRRSENTELEYERQRAMHELSLAEARHRFERQEFERDRETVGDDPLRVLLMAYTAGQLPATALAEQLLDLERLRQRREVQLSRAERQERQMLDERRRDDERHVMTTRVEIIKQLAARGHLDFVDIDPKLLMSEVLTSPGTLLAAEAAAAHARADGGTAADVVVREEDDD